MSEEILRKDVVHLSPFKYLTGCLLTAILVLAIGKFHPLPDSLIVAEVFVTVIGLFVFGSIRYRLDKNALTYGAVIVITATFWTIWWPDSELRHSFLSQGFPALLEFISRILFSFHKWDELVHADTMLFILGLTFFVAVIAQTRLLETISFSILNKNKGMVVPTVALIAAIVSVASGILDGVSMIGLMIRTLVIILFLAKAKDEVVVYAVVVSTVVTTVCGMWLAYGEPPNLIMKANLAPHLNDAFFLRYCLPMAVGSYFIVFWNIKRKLSGQKVSIQNLDVLDLHTADIRFLQASRHGNVLTPIEFVEEHESVLGDQYEPIMRRLHQGEPLGQCLINEGVDETIRRDLLGKYVSDDLSPALDIHYQGILRGKDHDAEKSNQTIQTALKYIRRRRIQAQRVGVISLIPFIGFLVWHAVNHSIPLYVSSFAGFIVAVLGILSISKMSRLALKEARHEFSEYLFLLPLFFSITLLQKIGFLDQISDLLRAGIEKMGPSHLAAGQFIGTTFLSALLDNNVVADFAGRALRGLDVGILKLFAMAQIAGYAVGGCWTHIGSAQSVVAYSFIRKEVDEHFTPFQWIKAMTPVIMELIVLMMVMIYGRAVIHWITSFM